jgi:hypothetical protein
VDTVFDFLLPFRDIIEGFPVGDVETKDDSDRSVRKMYKEMVNIPFVIASGYGPERLLASLLGMNELRGVTVSQIWILISLFLRVTICEPNSTPMVVS